MVDEKEIEERRLKIQVKVKRKKKENRKNKDDGSTKEGDGDPSRIANLKDDTTNTWHHHYQVSQDQKRATKGLQLNKLANSYRL